MSVSEMTANNLASSAHHEWQTLVRAAMLGTDRRPLDPGTDGWDAWCSNPDPAIQLLDRAAAAVIARPRGSEARSGPSRQSASTDGPTSDV